MYALASSEAYITASVIPLWRNAFIYASDVYKLGRQMGSSVTLSGSTFVDNVATAAGAAVYMSGDNQLVSQGNTFSGGQAGTQGGSVRTCWFHMRQAIKSMPANLLPISTVSLAQTHCLVFCVATACQAPHSSHPEW